MVTDHDGVLVGPVDILTPAVAREASLALPGNFYLGSSALTWVNGRTVTRYVAESEWDAARRARVIVADLTGDCPEATPSAQARRVLSWIGISQRPDGLAIAAVEECRWHYLRTVAGDYPEACQWDVSRAYWQILTRLPSPEVVWTRKGPLWGLCATETHDRWIRALHALGESKPLRNCLVGVMAGGGGTSYCWHRGEIRRMPTKRGPAYNAAALVVRSLYEACELESEHGGAVYANTDSVMFPDASKPSVWPQLGLGYRLEASGPAEVRGIGNYRIGEKATGWYGVSQWRQPDHESPRLASSGTWRWLHR